MKLLRKPKVKWRRRGDRLIRGELSKQEQPLCQ
jgi:hypothetical protein